MTTMKYIKIYFYTGGSIKTFEKGARPKNVGNSIFQAFMSSPKNARVEKFYGHSLKFGRIEKTLFSLLSISIFHIIFSFFLFFQASIFPAYNI